MNRIEYLTVTQAYQTEIPKIKGSRFIGNVIPVANKEQAEQTIKDFQKKNFDATHNCWAYRCWVNLHYDLFDQPHIDPLNRRDSDDWEPTWSAGRPIYKVIESMNLQNVLVIVTRYYGWTMLGIGWLVQAYTDATKAVLEHAQITSVSINDKVKLSFAYEHTAKAMYLINKYEWKVVAQRSEEESIMNILINKGLTQKFLHECSQTDKIAAKAI